MPGERVIHLITPGDHFSPRTGSAIPTVVDGLARAAERAGAPRHAVVLDESTWTPRYDSADIIEYVRAPGPTRLERYTDPLRGRMGMPRAAGARYYEPLAAAVSDLPPSVVLAHNAPIVPWLLRDSAHTVVLYAHNDLWGTYSRAEAGRALRDAAAIVCVSESLASTTRERVPAGIAERIHVVRSGVDPQQFTPRVARADGPVRIAFMGRVIPDKGPDVLLRAASELDSAHAEIVIIGRPGFAADAPLSDYERELRRLAGESRIPVRFAGFAARTELAEELRAVDVFVVPSRWNEPATLTVGEALATGLPTVASDIGGIPEMLGDAGMLVPADDPPALAAALRGLLADPDARGRWSQKARARAEARDWSWSWTHLSHVLDGL
ncbi:glycosyltransferase family 4 protein [Microbacterium sp. ASV49]|uniref:Glycosyltransferase family 4 protein n=1 Tax=Microbacterium candidum TaxID=3041922 RepID=A0ABT7MV04_9MICO|nr:glycosyltransferase family 4 protein [Microbacterium sp. ASV49]MDL9978278.1 glycosyltransferase family 4 protein [Microbacterium sp. ASV49]